MKKNDKLVSLQIPSKAHEILESYKRIKCKETLLVFSELIGIDLTDDFLVRIRIKTITEISTGNYAG
ncbi:hypothetical protein C7S20_15040 [Christiangramia fulva]|uniref:Uncharacterized protein n=1 Tax=Christiangramia fulva TaxID=2126553 RepID=A0A2R3Z8E0_9FLAO|nr:hypothetical protein C7S20_15040 [Christiangramia fulva]